jgi:PAS domain-containing protein
MFWKNVQTDFLDFFKRWSRILGSRFMEFLDSLFWGMFWKNVQTDFLDFFKRWSRILGSRFMEFLDGRFWGMFWKNVPSRFGEMEQNSLQQTDGRECWEGVLWNSWMAGFGGCFGKSDFRAI